MDAQRLHASFDSEPLYTKLYNPRWSHIPAAYTLEMNVDVQGLRIEILLSQPAPPPQCDSSSRRSPTVGMGLGEPEEPRAEMQPTKREGIFPLQVSVDGCTSPDQVGTAILLQADIGVYDAETTATNAQAAAREEFARPPKKAG